MTEQENEAYLRGDDITREKAQATGTAAPALQQDDQSATSAEPRQAEYVHAGMAFTDWFNGKVRQLVNPTITLGTKTASVIRLHPDGRLECSMHGEGGAEAQQFVAFEAQYLDQLLKRIAAIGL